MPRRPEPHVLNLEPGDYEAFRTIQSIDPQSIRRSEKSGVEVSRASRKRSGCIATMTVHQQLAGQKKTYASIPVEALRGTILQLGDDIRCLSGPRLTVKSWPAAYFSVDGNSLMLLARRLRIGAFPNSIPCVLCHRPIIRWRLKSGLATLILAAPRAFIHSKLQVILGRSI